jgi:hypothetical protein
MLFFVIKWGLIIVALAYIGKKIYPSCKKAYNWIKGIFSKKA